MADYNPYIIFSKTNPCATTDTMRYMMKGAMRRLTIKIIKLILVTLLASY